MSMTIKTKTLELNTIRLSGKPIGYYDNTTRGGWDITLVVDIGNGKQVRISMPLGDDKKAPFTEEQFKKGTVSFLNASFKSYVNKKDNRPVFQIKAGGRRSVLLETDIKQNDAFIGGIVSKVGEKNRRFVVDIKHKKGLPKPGEKIEYGIHQVLVTCPDDVALPKEGTEVIVQGLVDVTDAKMVGILANSVVTITE